MKTIICLSNDYRSDNSGAQFQACLRPECRAGVPLLIGIYSLTFTYNGREERILGLASDTNLFQTNTNFLAVFKALPGRNCIIPERTLYHISSKEKLSYPSFTLVDIQSGAIIDSSSSNTVLQLVYGEMQEEIIPPLFLNSSDTLSLSYFPGNTNTEFICKLDRGIRFEGRKNCWNASLHSIVLSHGGFFNVQKSKDYWFSFLHQYTGEDGVTVVLSNQKQEIPENLYRSTGELLNILTTLSDMAGFSIQWVTSQNRTKSAQTSQSQLKERIILKYEPSDHLKAIALDEIINVQALLTLSPALARMLGWVNPDYSGPDFTINFNPNQSNGLVFGRRRKTKNPVSLQDGLPEDALVNMNIIDYSYIGSAQLQSLNFLSLRKNILSPGEKDTPEFYEFKQNLFSPVKYSSELQEIRIKITNLQGETLRCIPNCYPTLLNLAFSM